MSWITTLAGKAEDILNKIDSDAATAFAKDKQKSARPSTAHSLNSVDHKYSNSHSLSSSYSVPCNLGDVSVSNHHFQSNSRESGSLTSSPKKKTTFSKNKTQEQSLIDFLNEDSKKSSEQTLIMENDQVNPAEVGHSRHSSISSGSSFLAVSGRETPGFTALEIDTNSGGSHASDAYVNVDSTPEGPLSTNSNSRTDSEDGNHSHSNHGNSKDSKESTDRQSDVILLRKEVLSLNQEMTQVLRRAKEAEKELQRCRNQASTLSLQQSQSEALLRDMQEKETVLQAELKSKQETIESLQNKLKETDLNILEREKASQELRQQNERLLQGANQTNNLHSDMVRNLQEKLKTSEETLEAEKEKNRLAFIEQANRICQLEEELKSVTQEIVELQRRVESGRVKNTSLNNQISSLKAELAGSRAELTDYKAKAGRILQSKDSLIASLKAGHAEEGADEVLAEEMEQLREERSLLREELQKSEEKSEQLAAEARQSEALLQQEVREALQKVTQTQEELLRERADAAHLQEEIKLSKKELNCLQEEFTRQKVNLSTRIQERDAEILELQKQIAHKQSSSSTMAELESRIHGLTESLIHKQTNIEALSTDKHTLQIQLERLQLQYNESQKLLNKDPCVDMPQEEVRNRVPTFLLESPFDGGVTRRVKKAYGSLDKFSVRLGVFLRRYPMSRVFVLVYIGLLHLWVMIVLLTYKPEVHDAMYIHPRPVVDDETQVLPKP